VNPAVGGVNLISSHARLVLMAEQVKRQVKLEQAALQLAKDRAEAQAAELMDMNRYNVHGWTIRSAATALPMLPGAD